MKGFAREAYLAPYEKLAFFATPKTRQAHPSNFRRFVVARPKSGVHTLRTAILSPMRGGAGPNLLFEFVLKSREELACRPLPIQQSMLMSGDPGSQRHAFESLVAM